MALGVLLQFCRIKQTFAKAWNHCIVGKNSFFGLVPAIGLMCLFRFALHDGCQQQWPGSIQFFSLGKYFCFEWFLSRNLKAVNGLVGSRGFLGACHFRHQMFNSPTNHAQLYFIEHFVPSNATTNYPGLVSRDRQFYTHLISTFQGILRVSMVNTWVIFRPGSLVDS